MPLRIDIKAKLHCPIKAHYREDGNSDLVYRDSCPTCLKLRDVYAAMLDLQVAIKDSERKGVLLELPTATR